MKVLYTGSFNPFHHGHEYIYKQACKMFGVEQVWIGIGKNKDKSEVDSEHLKMSIHPITRNVIAYDCLTADVVKKEGFQLLIRGVRPSFSMEEEFQLLHWNRELCGVETILLPSPPDLNNVSSGAIRTLLHYNQDISKYVNPWVLKRWQAHPKPDKRYRIYFGKCCSGKTTYLKKMNENTFAHKDLVCLDEVGWGYIEGFSKKELSSYKDLLKDLFYRKNRVDFEILYDRVLSKMNWDKLFLRFPPEHSVYDIPSLGWCWKTLPSEVIANSMLIRVSTSEENRQEFSKARKTNPNLIECSDFFYLNPPFWDEEIQVQKNE